MEINDLFRQLGLAARGTANGAAALPEMLWNGPAGFINQAAGTGIPMADLDPALDALGLPRPQNGPERIAQDVVGAMAGSGGVARLAGHVSQHAATDAQRAIAALFANAPGTQVASAATGAGAAGAAREAGIGAGGQLAAGLGAGMLPLAGAGIAARGSFSDKLAPTGEGHWGPIYGNLAGDPENAVAHLLSTRRGEVPAAATHPYAGPIDLVAGDAKSGLLHMEAKGRDDVLRALPELLQEGTWYSRPSSGPGRTYLGDDLREAVVRMDWDGLSKQWVPTAYDRGPKNSYPLETGRTTNRTDPGSGLLSPGNQAGSASIGEQRNPRQYVGILPPEEAAARRQMLEERMRAALFGSTFGTAAEGP